MLADTRSQASINAATVQHELRDLILKDYVRRHVYGLLKDGGMSRSFALLARAASESPDTEGERRLQRRHPVVRLRNECVRRICENRISVANFN